MHLIDSIACAVIHHILFYVSAGYVLRVAIPGAWIRILGGIQVRTVTPQHVPLRRWLGPPPRAPALLETVLELSLPVYVTSVQPGRCHIHGSCKEG